MTARFLRTSVVALSLLLGGAGMTARAQELNAKVTINHNQVQGSSTSGSGPICSFNATNA